MRVLISVDNSDTAEGAYDYYITNLHKPEHEVYVAHVSEPPKIPTMTLTEMGSFPADEITKRITDYNKKLKDLENKYTVKSGKPKYVLLQGEGSDAGQQIVSFSKERDIGLIVMGTRGLGKIRRTILGSVSDYVVHHTKIPVLIVPKN